MLLKSEWAELLEIWPRPFNKIGQCAAKLLTIQSIFTVRFAADNFKLYFSQMGT